MRYSETLRNRGFGHWFNIATMPLLAAVSAYFGPSLIGSQMPFIGLLFQVAIVVMAVFSVALLFRMRLTVEVSDQGIALQLPNRTNKTYWTPQILKVEPQSYSPFGSLARRLMDPVNGQAYGLAGYDRGARVFLHDGTSFFVAMGNPDAFKQAFDKVKAAYEGKS